MGREPPPLSLSQIRQDGTPRQWLGHGGRQRIAVQRHTHVHTRLYLIAVYSAHAIHAAPVGQRTSTFFRTADAWKWDGWAWTCGHAYRI